MSQFMQHFNHCKQVISEKGQTEEFKLHLTNLHNCKQGEYANKIQQLISLLLKQIIVKGNERFNLYFQALIEIKVNVNFIEKKDNKSLLMTACSEGTPDIVRELLKNGIDVMLKDNRNQTCLFYIFNQKGNEVCQKILKLILQHKSEIVNENASNNKSILFAAIQKKKQPLVKLILQNGGNPNSINIDQQQTALHIAVKNLKNQNKQLIRGTLKNIISLLLKYNCDYNKKNKQGKTALQTLETGSNSQFLIKQIQLIQQMNQNKVVVSKIVQNQHIVKQQQNSKQNLQNKQQVVTPSQQSKPNKQISKFKQRQNLSSIKLEIQNLRKIITNLEKEIEQAPCYQVKPAVPIENLYLKYDYLKMDLDQQINQYEQIIDFQKKKAEEILEIVKQKLDDIRVEVFLLKSNTTKINKLQFNMKIAICPTSTESQQTEHQHLESEKKLMLTVKNHLKNIKNLRFQNNQDPQNWKSVQSSWQQNQFKINVNIQFNKNAQHQSQSLLQIDKYIKQFPDIIIVYEIISIILRNMEFNIPCLGALSSYDIAILLASFSHNLKLNSQQIITKGQILLQFLQKIGFQFENIDKWIPISWAFSNFDPMVSDQFIQLKLVVLDPLNNKINMQVSPYFLQHLRNSLKSTYLLLRTNITKQHIQCNRLQMILKIKKTMGMQLKNNLF